MADLIERNLEGVLWREYDTGDRVYRIERPVKFWYREGGSTHRVLDAGGIVHIVPASAIIRYQKEPGVDQCQF